MKRSGTGKDPAVPHTDDPGFSRRLSWNGWFRGFDRDMHALLYPNKPAGRFSKLVRRRR